MKKIKKILAMMLAMAMVLGMSITSFAETKTSATITVENAEDILKVGSEGNQETVQASFSYVQVIKPDPTTKTGWAFTSEDIKKEYLAAFELTDDQEVLEILTEVTTKIQKPDDDNSAKVATTYTVAISKALKAVSQLITTEDGVKKSIYKPMRNPQNVTSAGVYAINILQEDVVYNPMAAYVGFGEVTVAGEEGTEDTIYEYPSLQDVVLTAKKTDVSTDKTIDDLDKAVEIGQIVTYTVTATVPYIDPDHNNRHFTITDKIKGAKYFLEGKDDLTGKDAIATVEMDGETVKEADETPVEIVVDTTPPKDYDEGFTVTLDNLIDNENSNAGKTVTVTYTARITEVTTENEAQGHAGGHDFSSKKTNVYTGQITLTKYGEASQGGTKPKLSGAGFEVYKTDEAGEKIEEALKFTKDGDADGVYIYDPNNGATEVFTGDDGTVVVKGLDKGSYKFVEKTAPDGYHIELEENCPTVMLGENITNDNIADNIFYSTGDLTDSKLASLPSTGGIGTTIFTIGGCAIMILAAALYFMTRRKSAK